MKLAKHVFTGADDNTDPEVLIKLSSEFKYVEWGVLIGKAEYGKQNVAKYPSLEWFQRRQEVKNIYIQIYTLNNLNYEHENNFI